MDWQKERDTTKTSYVLQKKNDFPAVRHTQHSGYGLRHIDSKIKSLLKMKREVQESRMSQTCVDVGRTVGGAVGVATQLLDLPDDCLHHIISFLYMPWDVLNLGLTDV